MVTVNGLIEGNSRHRGRSQPESRRLVELCPHIGVFDEQLRFDGRISVVKVGGQIHGPDVVKTMIHAEIEMFDVYAVTDGTGFNIILGLTKASPVDGQRAGHAGRTRHGVGLNLNRRFT